MPSTERGFIIYGVAPRWLPALLAGCIVNFFYGLAAMRKKASRWLVRSSLTGCFLYEPQSQNNKKHAFLKRCDEHGK